MLLKACATCWAADGHLGVTPEGVEDEGAAGPDGVPIINDERDAERDTGARASEAANGDD